MCLFTIARMSVFQVHSPVQWPAVQDSLLVAKMESLHELLPDASQNSVAPLTRRAKQTARVTLVKIDQ